MADQSEQKPSAFKHFLQQLKDRKVRKRLTIYLSAALTVLGVVQLFSSQYRLPRTLFDLTLIFLLCGIPCALTSAWIHGVQGAQKVAWREVGVYAFFALVGTFIAIKSGGMLPRGVVVNEGKSIAVLPFVNLSDNKEDEYFSDGVTEDILMHLSKIADLRVISRTSTMQYKETKKAIPEIAKELDVAYVLEGSVRRAGDRVRIVGQLIRAGDDEHVWAETYDRKAEDVFAIQTEVAETIAHELRAALSPEEKGRIEKRSTTNLEAYGLYLKGRDYYNRYTREDNDRAVALFGSALKIDSSYALAYAGLGDAYGMRARRYRVGEEWVDSAIVVSTRAIALDPALAEGYKALGLALDLKGETEQALLRYYKALELNPNYAPVLGNIGAIEYSLGHYDVALNWEKKAVALQPESAQNHTMVGLQYLHLGFDSAAAAWFQRAITLQPDMIFANILMSYTDLYRGNGDSAMGRVKRLLRVRPDELGLIEAAGDIALFTGQWDEAGRYYRKACTIREEEESPPGCKLAYVLQKTGNTKESKTLREKIIQDFDTPGEDYSSLAPLMLAQAYVMKGDVVRAAQCLSKGIDNGYRDYRWVERDPILEPLRSDPAGADVIARLKREYDSMRERVMVKSASVSQN